MPISSVVLSSQRVDLKDAIYDAAKAKDRAKDDAVNPLVQDGKKLVPSVTRVFNQNRDIYVYLQAYKPPAACAHPAAPPTAPQPATQPLMAFVTLYANGAEALKTQPIAVAPNAATRLGITPLNFNVSAASLKPGQYECQVTVLDPVDRKSRLLARTDRHCAVILLKSASASAVTKVAADCSADPLPWA